MALEAHSDIFFLFRSSFFVFIKQNQSGVYIFISKVIELQDGEEIVRNAILASNNIRYFWFGSHFGPPQSQYYSLQTLYNTSFT